MLLRTAALLSLMPLAAMAQQPDPRLAGPMIDALQSQVRLQQAIMRVKEHDFSARLLLVAPAMRALRWATNPMVE